ncbi:transposase family protein [Nostoc sp.]|uniref:transposase family protein n=1 Tax=Nostoc sp. TaxID=1180 RepID=UPI002FF55854
MKLKPKIKIADHLTQISDPRIDHTKRHKLIDILTITICAVICGADSWVAIELYGCTKYEWLKTFLELPRSPCDFSSVATIFNHH